MRYIVLKKWSASSDVSVRCCHTKAQVQTRVLRSLYVMLCYVVGSWWLMSPDALQPKAYCTNPGL